MLSLSPYPTIPSSKTSIVPRKPLGNILRQTHLRNNIPPLFHRSSLPISCLLVQLRSPPVIPKKNAHTRSPVSPPPPPPLPSKAHKPPKCPVRHASTPPLMRARSGTNHACPHKQSRISPVCNPFAAPVLRRCRPAALGAWGSFVFLTRKTSSCGRAVRQWLLHGNEHQHPGPRRCLRTLLLLLRLSSLLGDTAKKDRFPLTLGGAIECQLCHDFRVSEV